MSPRLGAAASEPPPNSTPQAKNVDRIAPGEPFRDPVAGSPWRTVWLRPTPASAAIAEAGFLGSRERRAFLWVDVSRSTIERGHELADEQNAPCHRALVRSWTEAERQAADAVRRARDVAADAARQAEEMAELDAEEADRPGPLGFVPPRACDLAPEDRDHRAVIRFLPPELAPFLTRMHPARRREREQAIFAYVGMEGLELLGLGPALLAHEAADRARRYAVRFPRQDDYGNPTHQEPVHRKGRCEKWHRRRLVKKQTRALLYVEQALGAVGGPDVPGRPLYVSDYSLTLHREQARRTAEILKELRLVMVEDPTVQIPMAELNERAKVADVTKRRLLIDALLRRFADLGWNVCWITITLPGRYVANATNEENRVEGWDPALGPQEALDALQEMHHQTMALLRERGIRPCGWWNAQPQQSGTPHRHVIVACRTQDDARAVCDAFWNRFSSTPIEKRQAERKRADPGCSAYVIGDKDARYAPLRGKNGKVETAMSIAKYAARYSTRCEAAQRASEATEERAGQIDARQEQQGEEQERFAAWKTRRRVRGHTWVGFDSGRSPMETWDTLWANAMRTDDLPDDPRMALAMRLMRETQAHADNAADFRRRAVDIDFGKERDVELVHAEEESDRAAFLAWHAGIAMGLWPDTDLDQTELDWLRSETREADALPPMPLRVTKETAYGEERRTVIGCVAPEHRFTIAGRMSVKTLLPIAERLGVAIEVPENGKVRPRHVIAALKRAGYGISRRPDGTRAGFDLSGEVLLRTEKEWRIVDTATAAMMVAEAEVGMIAAPVGGDDTAAVSGRKRLDHLSDSPTDPRNGAQPHPGWERQGDDPPPDDTGSNTQPN